MTPLSPTSDDLPPVGAPRTPATGSAERLRDAGFRMLSRPACHWMADPKLDQLRAEPGLGPVAPGRHFDSSQPPYPIPEYHRPGHVHFAGRDPDAGGGARTGPDTQADHGARIGRETGVERDAPVGPDPQTEGSARIGRDPRAGDGAPDPQTEEGTPGPDVLVVDTTVLGRLPVTVRAAAFLPHDLLLSKVDVIVTDGGWGELLTVAAGGDTAAYLLGDLLTG